MSSMAESRPCWRLWKLLGSPVVPLAPFILSFFFGRGGGVKVAFEVIANQKKGTLTVVWLLGSRFPYNQLRLHSRRQPSSTTRLLVVKAFRSSGSGAPDRTRTAGLYSLNRLMVAPMQLFVR